MRFAADCPIVGEICAAANFGERRGGLSVDMLVLHYTGMADDVAAVKRLTEAEGEVSCHYMVFESGRIIQMVPENLRAWHAGLSCWRGHRDINSRSIGIEIGNPGHDHGYRAFAAAQIEATIALSQDIARRHAIPARNVVAHSDIAPQRKCDPGELFPWRRLAECGVGIWVEPEPVGEDENPLAAGSEGPQVKRLRAGLARFGYPITAGDRFDKTCQQCVMAFQRHFRPARVDGKADRSTIATLEKLNLAVREGG